MRATGLDGVEWTVRRRWLPRYEGRGLRERLHQRKARAAARRAAEEGKVGTAGKDGKARNKHGSRWFDVVDLPIIDDSLTAAIVSVLVILLVIALIVWGVPLLLALVDLVFVVIVAVAGVVGRVLFRRPWTIEARAADGRQQEVRVVGWRKGGTVIDDLAAEIRHGRAPVPRG